jgi:DNA polymerase
MRRIEAEGSLAARALLVGEAGGENEERIGRPFVGASGFKLNSWWQPLGLSRSDFRIDNVYPYRPPHNNLDALDRDVLHEWANDLHYRVAEMHDPYVIVPTGATALRALMRRDLNDKSISIVKYRGSIMRYVDLNGREIKMLPTIHPASIYHQRAKKAREQVKTNPGRTEKHCRIDWARIAHEMTFREIDAPEETYYIVDQPSDLAYWSDYFRTAVYGETALTLDIETPHNVVDCVGFSWNPNFSISIPLHWPDCDPATYVQRRLLIETICTSPNPKVMQNGFFDTFWLRRAEGIEVSNYIYDLMVMHQILDPVDDHDLAYMKSIFLRGEYHKDEAKRPETAMKYASSYEAMLTYNGMDCCTQIALYYELRRRLEEAGCWQLYTDHVAPLLEVLVDMSCGGILTSRGQRRRTHARLIADIVGIQDQLTALAGEPLHAKIDLSRTKLKRFLYEKLGLPPQRDRAKRDGTGGGLTVKETALRRLQLRYPKQCGDAISLILDHRRKLKLSQFLVDAKTDDDDRLRCQYAPMAESARCTSSGNPMGTGANLFNQDRAPEVRSTFIPDRPDHVLVELDASQIESRLVYVMSGDPALQKLAMLSPDEFDQHSYNAHIVYGASKQKLLGEKSYEVKSPDLVHLGYVSYDQRYLGKRFSHGAQRGMGGEKLAELLLNEDIVLTPDECQRRIDRWLRELPGHNDYFEWVRWKVLREKQLTTSWGFCWNVEHEKMDADLYRRAYSLLPQSECAFLLYSVLVPTWRAIREFGIDARVLTSVYDSVVLSIVNDASTIARIITPMFQWLGKPRTYATRTGHFALSMFGEVKIGRDWSMRDGVEWKRCPTFEELKVALPRLKDKQSSLND